MRVGVFHTTLPETGRRPGGVEVFVHRLSNGLTARGHDVTVFSLTERAPDDARYTLRRVARPGLSGRATRLTILPLLLNRVDWSGLDVLSLHGDDWFFARRPLPTIRTFYGSALDEARSATSLRRKIAERLVYPAELLASRIADGSYASAARMPAGYRLTGRLPLAYEPGTQERCPRSPRPTVLFVGTWEGRKRGRFLRDVFIRDVLPVVPDAELWMVADRCDETSSVRWIPSPTDAELEALYQRAWVLCLPSTFEGFGIPYIEAMAHGAAVVASPNPGAIWATDGGKAGVIAEDDELARAISGLLVDAPARSALAEAGAKRVLDFTWGQACLAYEDAFRHAIETHRGERRA